MSVQFFCDETQEDERVRILSREEALDCFPLFKYYNPDINTQDGPEHYVAVKCPTESGKNYEKLFTSAFWNALVEAGYIPDDFVHLDKDQLNLFYKMPEVKLQAFLDKRESHGRTCCTTHAGTGSETRCLSHERATARLVKKALAHHMRLNKDSSWVLTECNQLLAEG